MKELFLFDPLKDDVDSKMYRYAGICITKFDSQVQ